MTKRDLVLLLLVPVTAIAGIVHSNLFSSGQSESTPPSLSTVSVEPRIVGQSVLSTGIIKPRTGAEVKVGAQVSGVVKTLYVEVGMRVRMGDLLAEIESTGFKAKADLAMAQWKTVQTELKFAAIERERSRALRDQAVISSQEMESADRTYELAESRLEQAQADLDFARLQLRYTQIRSPIDGVVSSVATQKGETVTASFAAPTFVTIIDLNNLELWAYVDETDIGRVRNGQAVTFTVDTYPGEEFSGTVKTIYPKAEIQNNVVNYIALITIEKRPDRIIRPEMTANVRIHGGGKTPVLTLPLAALHKEGKRWYVYVLSGSVPAKRPVDTGASDKKFVEVRSGLSRDDRVVVGDVEQENTKHSAQ